LFYQDKSKHGDNKPNISVQQAVIEFKIEPDALKINGGPTLESQATRVQATLPNIS